MPGKESPKPTGRYVPAAGRSGLSSLYDPVMALTMRERRWRPEVVDAVLAEPSPQRVLDVGVGTGTLAVEIAGRAPKVKILGIDGDQEILARAAKKATEHGAQIELIEGRAEQLPLPDGSTDVVVMTLILHHLDSEAKHAALTEARRVLRRGGRLVVADWGKPPDPLSRGLFLLLQLLDGFATTNPHAAGEMPRIIEQCGFSNVRRGGRWRTAWGTLELLVGEKSQLATRR